MLKISLRAAALLSFMEGCLISYWLASFSVLSTIRILSLLMVLLVSAGFLLVSYRLRTDEVADRLARLVAALRHRAALALFLLLMALTLGALALQKEYWLLYSSQAMYERILPLLALGALLGINLGTVLLVPDLERSPRNGGTFRAMKTTALLFVIFLAVGLFISTTRIGLTVDLVGLSWGTTGTPVSLPQIALVVTVSLWLAFAHWLIERRFPVVHSRWVVVQNIALFLGLWALAVALWSHQPMSPTHFAPTPVPPNDEYYPSSDAQIFDMSAHHLLIGHGFDDHLVRRPLYVGMLALFHAAVGPEYDDVIRLQLWLLALLPALVFLVAAGLSNRLGGLIAAGLVLVRESNAIALSGEIVTSHAKLMMSDLAAMLGILLTFAVAVPLLKKKVPDPWLAAVSGACLGLTVLVRAQVVVLFPVLALWILLARKSLRPALKEWIGLGLGLALVLAPWLGRNWSLTGTLVLDDRGEERLMARNYSASPLSLPEPLPGESEQAFSARLKADVLTYLREHPADTAFFIGNHFLHNLVTSSVFLAPVYSTLSTHEVVAQLPFWRLWRGEFPSGSALALLVNLSLLAGGIFLAVRKDNLTGWLPLAAFLVYSAGNALARSSGWRFSLPVDWAVIVYFAAALAYLPARLAVSAGGLPSVEESRQASVRPALGAALLGGLFLLGLAVPLAERLIPARDLAPYAQQAAAALTKEGILSEAALADFLAQKDAVLLSGMDLYPRFYRPFGRIYYLDDTPADMKYLHFWLINQEDTQVILPVDLPPNGFPHGAYVSVLGCDMGRYVQARVIILHGARAKVYLPEPKGDFACP